MLKLVILPLLKRYWYHFALVGVTLIAAFAMRSCVAERDKRITEDATRRAHFTRDSAQVAALRDSVVHSRQAYDISADTLKKLLRAYNAVRPVRSVGSTLPVIESASLIDVRVLETVSPAVVIAFCKEFVEAADLYKRYADSTMAAQARVINNFNTRVVEKSAKRKIVTTLALGVLSGYALAKSF